MLNERIRNLRLAKGLTLQAVADVFGISRASIASWESGNSNPDHKKLIGLAHIFGCSVQFLLTGSDSNEFQPKNFGVKFISFIDLTDKQSSGVTNQTVLPLHSTPSEKAFATRYPGRAGLSWAPLCVPAGSLLIVDPQVNVGPTSTVLLKLKKSSEVFLAQVKQAPDNKKYFLLDDENKTQIAQDQKTKVFGVILEWQLSGKMH